MTISNYSNLTAAYLAITNTSTINYLAKIKRDNVEYLELNSTISEFNSSTAVDIAIQYPKVIIPRYANGTILNQSDFSRLKTDSTNQFVTSLRSFYNSTLPVDTQVTLYYDNNNVTMVNLTDGVLEVDILRNIIVNANIDTNVTISGIVYECNASVNCTI